MSSVVLNGDTSGAITLAAPAVAGTNTITFPASTGTIVTTGSPQSGSVLQVLQAVSSTQTSATSTYTDATGVSITITPKFSTSKILIASTISAYIQSNGMGMQLLRNGSVIYNPSPSDSTGPYYAYIGVTNNLLPVSLEYLDSPATTSATTYNIQFRSYTGSTIVNYNGGGAVAGKSTITVMEIAA